MDNKIDYFIEMISNERKLENTVNPYSTEWEFNEIAKHNLKIYFENILANNSKVLLLGEAPGYKGCRLSGVPFTSEKILTSGKSNAIVGINFDYKIRDDKNPQSESSATIIWEAFENLDIYPLMWNAFPFHPHKPNSTESNRAPKRDELEIGVKYIHELIKIFDIDRIYAVGNIAYSTLANLGLKVDKIRHPSMGGKNQFIEGIKKLKEEQEIKTVV